MPLLCGPNDVPCLKVNHSLEMKQIFYLQAWTEFWNKVTSSYPRFMLQHLALGCHTYCPPFSFLVVIKTRTVHFDFQATTPCFSKDRLTLQAKRLADIFLKYQLGVLFVQGKDFHRIREIILAVWRDFHATHSRIQVFWLCWWWDVSNPSHDICWPLLKSLNG